MKGGNEGEKRGKGDVQDSPRKSHPLHIGGYHRNTWPQGNKEDQNTGIFIRYHSKYKRHEKRQARDEESYMFMAILASVRRHASHSATRIRLT